MGGWTDRWTNGGQLAEWTCGWGMNGWVDACMDRWVGVWTIRNYYDYGTATSDVFIFLKEKKKQTKKTAEFR